jgi:hypothetical protein
VSVRQTIGEVIGNMVMVTGDCILTLSEGAAYD